MHRVRGSRAFWILSETKVFVTGKIAKRHRRTDGEKQQRTHYGLPLRIVRVFRTSPTGRSMSPRNASESAYVQYNMAYFTNLRRRLNAVTCSFFETSVCMKGQYERRLRARDLNRHYGSGFGDFRLFGFVVVNSTVS